MSDRAPAGDGASADPDTGPAGLDRHLVVVGLMGVGKSTVGRALADRLGLRHVDSDADIETLTGMTGARIAAEYGVSMLHELEAAVLLGSLAAPASNVVSAAASTVEQPMVRLGLGRRAVVIRLVLDLETVLARQRLGRHRRRMGAEELAALAAAREPFFAEVEDLRVTADRPPSDLVDQIVEFLADRRRI